MEPAALSDLQKHDNQDWVYVDDIVSSKLEYHHLKLNFVNNERSLWPLMFFRHWTVYVNTILAEVNHV